MVGPCNGNMEQFWYDKEKDDCFSFNYGGCQGNGNKFDTLTFCENRFIILAMADKCIMSFLGARKELGQEDLKARSQLELISATFR